MQLSARSVVQGGTMGPHRSPVKGASVEFRQHRFYVPGDEPRRLDWRVLGGTGRPYVKEDDEGKNLSSGVVVGAGGGEKYCGGVVSQVGYATKMLGSLGDFVFGPRESG